MITTVHSAQWRGGEGQAASSISFEQKTLNKKIYIEVTAEAIAI